VDDISKLPPGTGGGKDRPTCIGLTNVLVAPLKFFACHWGNPGGFVGYKGLFFITLLLVLTALCLSAGMPEPRKGLCGALKSALYPGAESPALIEERCFKSC
jgi:hypothetical protein